MNHDAPTARPCIVVIDDDPAMRLSCRKILDKSGYRTETFEDGVQGLEGVERLKPDLVIVDLKMPGISGLEVISRVLEMDPAAVIVVITGYATIDTAVEAMKAGAYDFLPKPFSPDELRIIVQRGLERRRLMLEARRQELERELLRRRFVTFVSHQLQTPLAAVHQYLTVLRELEDHPEGAARRREWYERCVRRVEEMLALIRNWLTLAAIEGQCLAQQRVPVDPAAIIGSVLEECRALAEPEGIVLEVETVPESCRCLADPVCLRVLLENLVSNAIKYNRPGGRVRVGARPANGEVELVVSDTGVGIPKQYQPFLFDEFFRVRQPEAASKPGAGLGLAIVKRIVTELGGRVEVASEPGQGSTFRVRLPAAPEPVQEDHRAACPAQTPHRG
ncbi:MAG: hybrid sensor histidine kinase/response regulator [Bryobacterales bacterium]|nr:hybrid sensor histidine kinase/response regulator [Bryobacterales bacterium]